MATFCWVIRGGGEKFSQEEDRGAQQPLRCIVKERVLPTATRISIGVDDGLGEDLGVFLSLGSGGDILGILPGDVHISVDKGEQVGTVRVGGVPQVNDRHPEAIVFPGNCPVVSGQIPFGIQRQETHSAGTGVFEVGIKEEGGFAYAAGANHKTVNVVIVHQRGGFAFALYTAQHKALLLGAVVAFPPVLDQKGDVGVGGLDFLGSGPPSCAVMSIPHGLGLDAIESAVVGEGGDQDDKAHKPCHGPNEWDELFHYAITIPFACVCSSKGAQTSSFQSLHKGRRTPLWCPPL